MPIVGTKLLNQALGDNAWVPLFLKRKGKVEKVLCRDFFVASSQREGRAGRSFRVSPEGMDYGEVALVLVRAPDGDMILAVNTTKDDFVLSFTRTKAAASPELMNVLLRGDENGNNVINITSIFVRFSLGFLVVTPRLLLDQDFAHHIPWESSIIIGNAYFENILGKTRWDFPLNPGSIDVSVSWQGSPLLCISNSSLVPVAVAVCMAFENPANIYTTTMLVYPKDPQTTPIRDTRPLSYINIIVLAPYTSQVQYLLSYEHPVYANFKNAPSVDFFSLANSIDF